IFVSWNRDSSHGASVWFARSIDGGQHFTLPLLLYRSSGNNYGSVPIVSPRGQVYVFWSTFPDGETAAALPTRILMRASTDNGVHFGPVRRVSGVFRGLPQVLQPGALRIFPMPSPAADKQGTLYVA